MQSSGVHRIRKIQSSGVHKISEIWSSSSQNEKMVEFRVHNPQKGGVPEFSFTPARALFAYIFQQHEHWVITLDCSSNLGMHAHENMQKYKQLNYALF